MVSSFLIGVVVYVMVLVLAVIFYKVIDLIFNEKDDE